MRGETDFIGSTYPPASASRIPVPESIPSTIKFRIGIQRPDDSIINDTPKTKTEAAMPPYFSLRSDRTLPEPSRRVREQGVDHPGLGGEMLAEHRGPAPVAGPLGGQCS